MTMTDDDRHLLQMAALNGQVGGDMLTNEDLIEIELKIMQAIVNKKILENKACVDSTSYLQ